MQHFMQMNEGRVILKPANEAVFEDSNSGLVEVDQELVYPTLEEDNSLENLLY